VTEAEFSAVAGPKKIVNPSLRRTALHELARQNQEKPLSSVLFEPHRPLWTRPESGAPENQRPDLTRISSPLPTTMPKKKAAESATITMTELLQLANGVSRLLTQRGSGRHRASILKRSGLLTNSIVKARGGTREAN
jgi:hypothetical protein